MQKVANIKRPKLKSLNPIHILVIALLSIILIGIANPPLTASAKTTAKMNIGESANSYLYYTALRECILNNQMSYSVVGNNTIISEADANQLNWFSLNYSDPNDGDYLKTVGGITPQKPSNQIIDTLHCRGKPSNTIQKALEAWGYSSGTEALCAFGLKRRTITTSTTTPGTNQTTSTGGNDVDCLAGDPGQDEFYTDSSGKIDVNKFDKAIDEKIGKPVFTSAIKYHLYRQALFTGCLGVDAVANPLVKPTEDTSGDASSSSNKVYTIVDVDDNGDTKTKNYKGVKSKSDTVVFYLTPRGWSTMTCGELEVHTNSATLAKAYGDKLKENLKDPEIAKEGSEVTPATKKDATCGSEMKLLGWIICPIIEGLADLNDMMFKLIEGLLIVNPLTQDTSDSTYIAWGSMRNIANAAFVIAFLIIIFSQMSGAGITNYGIKKLLPKLIVCAILVNLSYLIMQVLVDIANIAGSSIYGALKALTPAETTNNISWKGLLGLSITGVLGSAGLTLGVATIGASTMIWLLLPVIIAGTLAFVAAFATLVFRRAAIPILAILSPLAFVAFLLPNTESWFKKWKDALTSMLVLYPTAALLFGACYFVSRSMIGDGKDWWNLMMGLIVMALPLFSLPFIAKQGGAILSKVNGALSSAADKLKKPVNNWTSERAEYASEMSKNRAMNSNKPSLRGSYLRSQARRNAIKNSQAENFKRGEASYIAEQALNPNSDRFLNQLSKGGAMGAEERALARATEVKAKITAEEVSAQTALIKDFNKDQIAELAMGGTTNVGGREYNAKQSASLRTAAMKRAVDTGDIETINKLLDQSAEVDSNGDAIMDMETRTSLGNTLLESSGTPTYVGKSTAAKIKEGTKAGNATQIIKSSLSVDKPLYSTNKLADAADDELRAVLDVINDPTNGVTAAEKKIIRDNAELAATDSTYQGRIAKQINEIEKLRKI